MCPKIYHIICTQKDIISIAHTQKVLLKTKKHNLLQYQKTESSPRLDWLLIDAHPLTAPVPLPLAAADPPPLALI